MLLHIYNRGKRNTLFSATTTHAASLVARLVSLTIDLDATVCTCDVPVSYCHCAPPLHSAIWHSNIPMVTALLSHGASITARCPTSGDNAVHYALFTTDLHSGHFKIARDSDVAILRLLLSGGRLRRMNDPAALSAGGKSWLNTAVRTCPRTSVALVRLFLVRGLHVNVADAEGLTPLHIAVWNNRPDLASMLLQRGADHRSVDSRGTTPWSTACNRPNCELVAILLHRDAGLVAVAVNADGESPEACLRRSLEGLVRREDHESEYFVREFRERTRMLEKLVQLGRVSRSVVGVRCVLQVYYFGM